jgi:hypothetical protein
LRPLMSAINPTPQESFSSAGSKRPKPDASIVVLAILPEPRPTRHQGSDAITAALLSRHLPHAADRTKSACAQGASLWARHSSWRQPLCRWSGRSGCLFSPLGAPSPLAADPAPAPSLAEAARHGSPIGTAMLSYAEHGKFRNPTQAPDPVPSFPTGHDAERKRTKTRCRPPGGHRFLQTFRRRSGSWQGLSRNAR